MVSYQSYLERRQQQRNQKFEQLNHKAKLLRAELGYEPNQCLQLLSSGHNQRVKLAPFLCGLSAGVFVTSEHIYNIVHDAFHQGYVLGAGPDITALTKVKGALGARFILRGQRHKAVEVGRNLDLLLSQAQSTGIIANLLSIGDDQDPPLPAAFIPEESVRIMGQQNQFEVNLKEVALQAVIERQLLAESVLD